MSLDGDDFDPDEEEVDEPLFPMLIPRTSRPIPPLLDCEPELEPDDFELEEPVDFAAADELELDPDPDPPRIFPTSNPRSLCVEPELEPEDAFGVDFTAAVFDAEAEEEEEDLAFEPEPPTRFPTRLPTSPAFDFGVAFAAAEDEEELEEVVDVAFVELDVVETLVDVEATVDEAFVDVAFVDAFPATAPTTSPRSPRL